MLTLTQRIEATIQSFRASTGTVITRAVLAQAADVLQEHLDADGGGGSSSFLQSEMDIFNPKEK